MSGRIGAVANTISNTSTGKQSKDQITLGSHQVKAKSVDTCLMDDSDKNVSTSSAERVSNAKGSAAKGAPITLQSCFSLEKERTSEADDSQRSFLEVPEFASKFLEGMVAWLCCLTFICLESFSIICQNLVSMCLQIYFYDNKDWRLGADFNCLRLSRYSTILC